METVLRFEDVSDGVLRGVSLALGPGEVLSLLGPAGAGKSTLLRLAAGQAPRSGQVLRTAPARLVPQPPGLMARLWRTAPPRDVALRAAIAARPGMLLLDAPLRDTPGDAALLALRALLRNAGVAMLHATRDPAEALALADRIAVLHDGRLLALGTPRALYQRPPDLAVARLLGEANLLPGAVAEDGLVRLDAGAWVEAEADFTGRCVVLVRPERVVVANVAAAELGAESALPARLVETLFRGDHLRLRLALADGTEVVARRPIGGGALPAVGAEAAIAWPGDAAMVFREGLGVGALG